MKSIFVFIVGVLAFVYMLNPTAGIFEFLPDNLPFFGNLDEATAMALLLSSLAYFGIDLSQLFARTKAPTKTQGVKDAEYEDIS
jgi:hypothetical protein